MKAIVLRRGALAGFAMVLALLLNASANADNLKIAAAANLQKIMTKALIPAFEKETGQAVTPTFGSTKLLARQIQQGAPVDLFIAADKVTADDLAKRNFVVGSTERVYAIGKLVLWSRSDSPRHPQKIADLANAAYAKIAIANPQVAPYGLAAQQALARSHLTAIVRRRLVRAENIAQALAYAQSGNADVALTALSLVIDDKRDPYVIVPASLHSPITQAAAVVKGAKNPDLARRFLEFITGKQSASVWRRYGYDLPGK